jgi:ABC-type enterobactin transport system permease subunit
MTAAIDPGGTGIAGTLTCPQCTAPVPAEQDWCLRCGTAARTRLVPTPNWRLPLALAAVLAILALGVLAAAFVALTADPGAAGAAGGTATTPQSQP